MQSSHQTDSNVANHYDTFQGSRNTPSASDSVPSTKTNLYESLDKRSPSQYQVLSHAQNSSSDQPQTSHLMQDFDQKALFSTDVFYDKLSVNHALQSQYEVLSVNSMRTMVSPPDAGDLYSVLSTRACRPPAVDETALEPSSGYLEIGSKEESLL